MTKIKSIISGITIFGLMGGIYYIDINDYSLKAMSKLGKPIASYQIRKETSNLTNLLNGSENKYTKEVFELSQKYISKEYLAKNAKEVYTQNPLKYKTQILGSVSELSKKGGLETSLEIFEQISPEIQDQILKNRSKRLAKEAFETFKNKFLEYSNKFIEKINEYLGGKENEWRIKKN